MKKKLKVVEIKIEMFCSHIFVFWDGEPKDVAKYVRRNLRGLPKHMLDWLEDENNAKNQGVTLTDVGNSANALIWLKESPISPRGIEVLSHEAAHAAYRVMNHWNFQIVEDTQELLAMIVGHIVLKVLKTLYKK